MISIFVKQVSNTFETMNRNDADSSNGPFQAPRHRGPDRHDHEVRGRRGEFSELTWGGLTNMAFSRRGKQTLRLKSAKTSYSTTVLACALAIYYSMHVVKQM